MYNSEKPALDELPSTAQLLRSTLIALVAAIAILVTVVLPAEYGIDPTGAGRVLGLTEMGEIKDGLAKEAEQDKKAHANDGDQSYLLDGLMELLVSTAHAAETWTDEVTFTLAPGKAREVKLVMQKGATAYYQWSAEGGRMNFDLHAHGSGGKSVTYKKARGKQEGEGSFTTPFPGEHGWFWRNRDKSDVKVTLRVRGAYSKLNEQEK